MHADPVIHAARHTPECVTHKRSMLPRPVHSQTAEQRWCGTWYDCAACTNSVLLPSAALTQHLGASATGA